jgi:hypothetical protein
MVPGTNIIVLHNIVAKIGENICGFFPVFLQKFDHNKHA